MSLERLDKELHLQTNNKNSKQTADCYPFMGSQEPWTRECNCKNFVIFLEPFNFPGNAIFAITICFPIVISTNLLKIKRVCVLIFRTVRKKKAEI